MKAKEEMIATQDQVEINKKKLTELNEHELKEVLGGTGNWQTHNGTDISGQVSDKAQMPAWKLIFK